MWPHTQWSLCVCCTFQGSVCHRTHTFQHIEQAHTRLLGCPKPQPMKGHWGCRQAYTPGKAPKPSVGQTSTDSEFLNVKGKNKLQRRSVLLSHWNHFLSSPTMGEDQSFPRALAYRACTSCTTGCKDPVPSASVVAPLLPAILLLSPSLPLFS
jgi:hypothetical protein